MMKSILSAKNIRKSFLYPSAFEILKGISLDLYPGESIAILGASGEGKSTLLHILGTLEDATSGELFIAGNSVSKKSAPKIRSQHIGFIFQSFNLLDDYTVIQNALMPALIAHLPIHKGSESYEKACALLEKVGLDHRAQFTTKLLSGGEKQRLCLSRALLNDPEIILADEPSGNLDEENSVRIHELLLQCVKDYKKALIVVTHDTNLANLCDRKFRLNRGILFELGNYGSNFY